MDSRCFASSTYAPVILALLVALGCEDAGTLHKTMKPVTPAPDALSADELPSNEALEQHLDDVIAFTRERHLSPQVNNAWQIVHGILCYGNDLILDDNGKLVPAVDFVFDDAKFKGWTLVPGEKGLESVMQPGEKVGEGHEDQWIGYMSQCGIKPDCPIKVAGRKFTLQDMIEQAKWDVHDNMEATWTLMCLSTYLPLDAKWKAKDGKEWTIDMLVGIEVAQNLNESACGGSHRLYGLTVALNQYKKSGRPLTGAWLAVDKKIKESIETARQFQQPDGSFSTMFFQRAATDPDIGKRMNTTGHTLEFIALAADESQLKQPWLVRAVNYYCNLLEETKDLPLECAALYHGTHGLRIYRERAFGTPPAVPSTIAESK